MGFNNSSELLKSDPDDVVYLLFGLYFAITHSRVLALWDFLLLNTFLVGIPSDSVSVIERSKYALHVILLPTCRPLL